MTNYNELYGYSFYFSENNAQYLGITPDMNSPVLPAKLQDGDLVELFADEAQKIALYEGQLKNPESAQASLLNKETLDEIVNPIDLRKAFDKHYYVRVRREIK